MLLQTYMVSENPKNVTVWAKTSLVHTSDFTQVSGSKIL